LIELVEGDEASGKKKPKKSKEALVTKMTTVKKKRKESVSTSTTPTTVKRAHRSRSVEATLAVQQEQNVEKAEHEVEEEEKEEGKAAVKTRKSVPPESSPRGRSAESDTLHTSSHKPKKKTEKVTQERKERTFAISIGSQNQCSQKCQITTENQTIEETRGI